MLDPWLLAIEFMIISTLQIFDSMISYLKGIAIQIQTPTNTRSILILEVNGIGYELQIPQRMTDRKSVV